MAWDLATAHARLGTTASTALDAQYTLSMSSALAIVEAYLDRKLLNQAEVDEVAYPHHTGLGIKRYPIESVQSVANGNAGNVNISNYEVDKDAGVIKVSGYLFGDRVKVSYTGGYTTLPADLEYAMWLVFDAVNVSAAGGGGLAAGAIESLTIPDVGTIRYASGNAGSGGATSGAHGPIDAATIDILEPYRRFSA